MAADILVPELRKYLPSDVEALAELFYQTVHAVNAKDYTREQLDAWTTGSVDLEAWNRSFLEHYTIVALIDGKITGFGDIAPSGYLDRLYIHKDHQGRGIASAICDALESAVDTKQITVHASITAKPFFLRRDYRIVKEQQVVRKGIFLTNFIMEKRLS